MKTCTPHWLTSQVFCAKVILVLPYPLHKCVLGECKKEYWLIQKIIYWKTMITIMDHTSTSRDFIFWIEESFVYVILNIYIYYILFLLVYISPRFDIPAPDPQQQAKKAAIVCHMCGEAGHKAIHCQRLGQQTFLMGQSMLMPVSCLFDFFNV